MMVHGYRRQDSIVGRSQGFPVNDRQFVLACLAIFAVAVFLRLYHLGMEELWLDEALTAHLINQTDWTLPVEHNTPPLYYTVLRLWSLAAGNSEFALRFVSALLGSFFVLATIWMGKEVFNSSVGVWSGLFVAVNPVAIYYAQEARTYTLLLLLLSLVYTNLWKAVTRNSMKNWLLFCVCALLSLYSHYFAALALVPTAVLLLLWPTDERKDLRWRYYGCAVVCCAVFFLPFAAFKFLGAGQLTGLAWLEAMWRQTSPWLLILRSLEIFGVGPQPGVTFLDFKQWVSLDVPVWLHPIGVSLIGLLTVAALAPLGDRTLEVPQIGRRKIWLVALVCVPLLLLLSLSFVRPLYLVGRYDLVGFAAYPIVLGLGAAKLQRVDRFGSWIMLGVGMCLLGVVGTKLFLYYGTSTPSHRANARVTASYLEAKVKNGDVVVFTGLRGAPVIYYLGRLGYRWSAGRCVNGKNRRAFGCRMFPRETESHLGSFEPGRVWNSRDAVRSDLSEFVQDLGSRNSVWVVVGSGKNIAGVIQVSRLDSFLLTELQNKGYAPQSLHGAPIILRFTKP